MTQFSKEDYLLSLLKREPFLIVSGLVSDLRNRASTIASDASYIKHERENFTDVDREQFLNSIEQCANDIFNILEAYLEYDKISKIEGEKFWWAN